MSTYFGAVIQPQVSHTMKGIRWMINVFVIFMATGLLGIVTSALTMWLLTGDLLSPEILSKVIGILALACGLALLSLVGIILALVGFWTIYKGRAEYGSVHNTNVDRAVILFVAGIIVYSADFIVGMFVGFSSALGGISNPENVTLAGPIIQAVSAITSILLAAIIAFILYYLIKAFVPSDKHNVVVLAMGLYVAASLVSLVGTLALSPPTDYYAHPGSISFDPLWIVPSVIGGLLGFIALILFLILYRNVIGLMKTNQIRPIWSAYGPTPPLQPDQYRWQPPPSS
jgi:hypothetical protein